MTDEAGTLSVSMGDRRVAVTGIDTKTLLLALLLGAFVAFTWWQTYQDRQIERDSKATYLEQHKITHELLATVIVNMDNNKVLFADQVGEIIYVLTLDQKKREALKLDMPLSLRHKTN